MSRLATAPPPPAPPPPARPPSTEPIEVVHSIKLDNIDWAVYVKLRENPDNRHRRMTYDRGNLEIMTVSEFHELIQCIINDLITVWRMERRIAVRPSGSMTMRRLDIARGLEPDQSYYIQNEPIVAGLREFSLQSVPPPDLVIEVEHTSLAVAKMPIYAELGAPEVWRWRAEQLTVHRLSAGKYVEQADSVALPGFPLDLLRAALLRRHEVGETELLIEFREAITKMG